MGIKDLYIQEVQQLYESLGNVISAHNKIRTYNFKDIVLLDSPDLGLIQTLYNSIESHLKYEWDINEANR